MPKTIEAIYNQGVIKPIKPIEGFEDNAIIKVRILTYPEKKTSVLKFAGILSDEEAKEMMDIIEGEFERVNPDEWKD